MVRDRGHLSGYLYNMIIDLENAALVGVEIQRYEGYAVYWILPG